MELQSLLISVRASHCYCKSCPYLCELNTVIELQILPISMRASHCYCKSCPYLCELNTVIGLQILLISMRARHCYRVANLAYIYVSYTLLQSCKSCLYLCELYTVIELQISLISMQTRHCDRVANLAHIYVSYTLLQSCKSCLYLCELYTVIELQILLISMWAIHCYRVSNLAYIYNRIVVHLSAVSYMSHYLHVIANKIYFGWKKRHIWNLIQCAVFIGRTYAYPGVKDIEGFLHQRRVTTGIFTHLNFPVDSSPGWAEISF